MEDGSGQDEEVAKKMTRPNWKVIAVTSCANLTGAFSMSFPFSFTPHMMTHFGYSDDERGYYVGLLGSARFIGCTFGSFIFGFLSDRFGRRPTMLLTLLCQVALNLSFGFSTNFITAFIIRLLTGLLGGITPISKTIMYEVSDSTNQSVGMSILNTAFAIGIIIGSLVGGPLAQPITQYPGVFPNQGLLKLFPYCIPSIVVGFFCFVIFLLNFFFLPETRGARNRQVEEELNLNESEIAEDTEKTATILNSNSNICRHKEKHIFCSLQHIPMKELESRDCDKYGSESQINNRYRRAPNKAMSFAEMARLGGSQVVVDTMYYAENLPVKNGKSVETEKMNTVGIFAYCYKSSSLKKAISLYGLYGFGLLYLEESIVLYYSEKPIEGLGFMPKDIAIIVGSYCASMIPMMVCFPFLERKFGILKLHMLLLLPSLISILVSPFPRFLHKNPAALWAATFFTGLPFRLCILGTITCQNIFINNSVPPSTAGSANGLATLVTNVCRGIGALVGTSVFQWSVVTGLPYPLDVNIVFQGAGVVILLCALINYNLPTSIQKQCTVN